MSGPTPCPAGHPEPGVADRSDCRACRLAWPAARVARVETSLPATQVNAALTQVATSPAVLRSLATALNKDPRALVHGAPPSVGRLVEELIARGSTVLAAPACTTCGRTGTKLTAAADRALCRRCAHRSRATACTHCHLVKPVAGRDLAGQPICQRCRRHYRGQRPCGRCHRTAAIALSGRDGAPDICVNCYRQPQAQCHRCGRLRPCRFADTAQPLCETCAPRALSTCAHCGNQRPATARWTEGPVCDPCYTAALRHRGTCTGCGNHRRLVHPPGPGATTCTDCSGTPATGHRCSTCGLEDRLFAKDLCARCTLHRRTTRLLAAGDGTVPDHLTGVLEAITATSNPYSALNWLRTGATTALLADLTAGRLAASHDALDAHPQQRPADYLRHLLVATGALPERDEDLARTERWLQGRIGDLTAPEHQPLLRSRATWQAMHRLRRNAERNHRPRTYTAHLRSHVNHTIDFLNWPTTQDRSLPDCNQGDIDRWLATSPGATHARDFLAWAAQRGHCDTFHLPAPRHRTGPATDAEQRWDHPQRLLHDETLALTDRVAGSFLLLFGQPQSRISAMTRDQITDQDHTVLVRFGRHDVPMPDPLTDLLRRLLRNGRPHTATGTPAATPWLLPDGLPGRPITASRLGERLRLLGIRTMPGRRAALTDLAAQLPPAVLADLLGITPGTAVRWAQQSGSDWTAYAAQIARKPDHQP